jgi:lipopolysaccharide heptosyltransferase II
MKEHEKNILVILIAGIGDLIMASKAFRALRCGYPDSRLHLLTSTEASVLARNYPYLDHVWAFPVRQLDRSWLPMRDILDLIQALRKIDFELALDLYRVISWRGALRMGLLMSLLRPQIKAGHDSKGFGLFLDMKAAKNTFRNRHFTDAMMDLAIMAGGLSDDRRIEVFWEKSVEAKWKTFFPEVARELQPLRIGINPGADRPEKRWSPENYASVAERLSNLRGASIFLFGGPGEEHLATRIEKAMKHPVTNLAGKLSLNELAYLVSRLDLFLTNDSGPMHVAAALKTPVVALFGPEDPVHTRPYTSPDLYRIVQKDLSCRPCTDKRCDRPICMESLKPEDVLQACLELLALV